QGIFAAQPQWPIASHSDRASGFLQCRAPSPSLMSNVTRPNPPPAQPLVGAETQLVWRDPFDPAFTRNAIKIALLWLVTLAAYLPTVSGEFLWQDDRVITANESIRSWPTLVNAWRHPRAVALWRPVADTILWPQHIVWHAWNPGGYHLISLAI